MSPNEWVRYQFELEIDEEGSRGRPREWRDREINRRINAMPNTQLLALLDGWFADTERERHADPR